MNFIRSLSISSQGFPGTLRSIFANWFCWRGVDGGGGGGEGVSTQKMHISEYVCRTCLKELGIRNGMEIFEKFLAA